MNFFNKINFNKKQLQILIASIIVFTSFFIALFFFGIKYEVNDDAIISSIASGALGGYTERLIYVNILIGYLLKPLYALSPLMNWYVIFQLFFVLLSFIILSYISMDKLSILYGSLISVIAMILIGFDILIWFQYSKNAAVIITTGLIIIGFNLNKEKVINFSLFLGFVLVILGSMLRFESFFASFSLSLPFLLSKFNKQNLIKSSAIIILITTLAFTFEFINTASYTRDEIWCEYYEYNLAREDISDYKITFTNIEDSENYTLTQNEYALIYNWTFYDTEIFTTERLIEISDNMPVKSVLSTVSGTIYKSIHFLYSSPPFLLLGGILLAFLFFADYKKGFWFLSTFAILFVLIAYLVFVERIPHRVEMLLVFSAFIFSFSCFPFKKNLSLSLSSCCFIALFCVLISASYYETQKDTLDAREDREIHNSYFDALSEDKENLYIMDTSLLDVVMGYDVFKVLPEDYFSNIVFLGSWHSRSPISSDKLNNYGYENPFRALLDENTYFVTNNYTPIQNHLTKNYDSTAKIIEINDKSAPNFGVFKFITE